MIKNSNAKLKPNYNRPFLAWKQKIGKQKSPEPRAFALAGEFGTSRAPLLLFGGVDTLARELAIGVFVRARLLPKRFSADFVLARSADPALQLQNGLCANHALFRALGHCAAATG